MFYLPIGVCNPVAANFHCNVGLKGQQDSPWGGRGAKEPSHGEARPRVEADGLCPVSRREQCDHCQVLVVAVSNDGEGLSNPDVEDVSHWKVP